jgi:hypothetical protein
MDKFWQLLQESTLIQGAVTLALVGAVIYLSCTGQEIPTLLETMSGIVVGFWFGQKAQQAINARKASQS